MREHVDLHALDLDPFGAGPWTAPSPVAPVPLPDACDVAVVGAGVTGLSAALALATRGVPVTIVDRRFGRGASSRSGGIVLGDTLEGPAPGFDGCERTLAAWIAEEQIACGYVGTRCLELARDPTLAPGPIEWRDHGTVRVAARVPGGVLDPVQLLNGLLWSCRRAGAQVVTGVDVTRLDRDDGGTRVVSPLGTVRARRVILATDAVGWTGADDPWPSRTLTVAALTDPVASGVVEAIGLQPHQPFYTRELPLLWGRPLHDGSLLFGRELVPFPWAAPMGDAGAVLAAAGGRLGDRIRGLHSRLAGVRVARVWAGPTARTAAGVPAIVEHAQWPGVLWAGGYGGHGLAQAFTLGRRAAARTIASLTAAARITGA